MGNMKGQWTILYHRIAENVEEWQVFNSSALCLHVCRKSYGSEPINRQPHSQHRSGEPIVLSYLVSSRAGEKGEEKPAQGSSRVSFPGNKENTAACLPTSPSEPIFPLPFLFLLMVFQLLSLRYGESKGEHNYSLKLSCPPRDMFKHRSSQILIKVQMLILPQIHKDIFPNSFLNRKFSQ